MKQYTTEQIFRHMSPATIAAWVSDMDNAPEELESDDLDLMHAALAELFAIVGLEALDTLETYGVYALTTTRW